jgi:hypothetical protein
VLLIGAGLLFLLDNLGVINFNVWELWRLWPLLLIAIGLDLILGRRNPVLSLLVVVLVLAGGVALLYSTGALQPLGDVSRSDLNVPLNGAKSAVVRIESGVSKIVVNSTETSALADGTLEYYESWGAPQQTVDRAGDQVTLHVSQTGNKSVNFPGGQGPDWNISLSKQVPLDLQVDAGVGETILNLRESKLTNLSLDAGVGSVEVTVPEQAGVTTARIKGGVGALKLTIPDGVEARINVDSGLGGVDVDSRFRKEGDVYVSEGYAGATNRVDLNLSVGVGGVEVISR